MSVPSEEQPQNVRPGRWETASINMDDPDAPRRARVAEMRRVVRRTAFARPLSAHPEYEELDTTDLGQEDEAQYQCVTQDCDMICTRLQDNPKKRLSDDQRKLLTAVLGLPRHASKARIVAAHVARTRYMQIINLAVAYQASLNDLPRALKSAASPGCEPLTKEDETAAVEAFAAIISDGQCNDEDDLEYENYDWDEDEDEATAAVRSAEELLGYVEPRNRYPSPVSFDTTRLEGLGFEDLCRRCADELNRIIPLISLLPPATVERLEVALKRSYEEDDESGVADLILEVVDYYLDRYHDQLDDTGRLEARAMRFVCKILGLPRNTPTMKIFETYDDRSKYMARLTALMEEPLTQADSPPVPPAKPPRVVKRDTLPAIRAAKAIMAAQKAKMLRQAEQLAAWQTRDTLIEAERIVEMGVWDKIDPARAVWAAADHLRAINRLDDDDEDGPGDILVRV